MPNVALFYTDRAFDFTLPAGLATLRKYDNVVLQAEIGEVAISDNRWMPAAYDDSPVSDLESHGVTVHGYINPFWVWNPKELGGIAEEFRSAQAQAAERFGAIARNANGTPYTVFGGKMYLIDCRNRDYTSWFADQVIRLPFDSFFFDCAFYHTAGYHHGMIGSNDDYAEAIDKLTTLVRFEGKQIIGNSAWEPKNPEDVLYTYPYKDKFDGVCFEIPTGLSTDKGWWALLSYPRINTDRLVRVARDWQAVGADTWLVAKHQRLSPWAYNYSPFETFDAHCEYWAKFANANGFTLNVNRGSGSAEWNLSIASTSRPQGQPVSADRISVLEADVAALKKDVASLRRIAGI